MLNVNQLLKRLIALEAKVKELEEKLNKKEIKRSK